MALHSVLWSRLLLTIPAVEVAPRAGVPQDRLCDMRVIDSNMNTEAVRNKLWLLRRTVTCSIIQVELPVAHAATESLQESD